ncbi:hypothetical protein TNCV_585501 [Trichonephila clavipes]|nr:hypothetical protein TNCV_585501 [Trichonephila clavipes]
MPGKHSSEHNDPAYSLDHSGNGCRVFAFRGFAPRIQQQPSVRWSIKWDSSENATCHHSVDVQLWYWRANSSFPYR